MRITIIQGPFLPVPALRGGAVEKLWFELGKEFTRRGHAVTHFSRQFPGLPNEEVLWGVRHLRVSSFDGPRSWRPLGNVDFRWPMRLLLDFVYACRVRQRIPDADILVTNTFWMPVLMKTRSRHGCLFVQVARYPRGQVRLYSHAARLQTPSSASANALRARLPQCSDRICVIPNVLAAEASLATSAEFETTWTSRDKTIVFAGRIHPQKGLLILVDAFIRFASTAAGDGWRLRFVGPHEEALGGGGENYRLALLERGGELADRIEWTGFVREPGDLKRHLVAAGLFVYPSIDEFGETFGVAPLEAMGCGCPTIVSALECFRDFVVDGETGFVFDHRHVQAAGNLAALFERSLAKPTELHDLALRGWQTTRRFQIDSVAGEFLAEFKTIVDERP